jgi:hypothetical protein
MGKRTILISMLALGGCASQSLLCEQIGDAGASTKAYTVELPNGCEIVARKGDLAELQCVDDRVGFIADNLLAPGSE